MNKEEILNKYIDLIDKGYCCACNELNCIDNFPHAKITRAIRNLQQENKQLKDNWNKLKEYIKKCLEAIDTIQKLTGNAIENYTPRILTYKQIKNKMQELEQGSDSNE